MCAHPMRHVRSVPLVQPDPDSICRASELDLATPIPPQFDSVRVAPGCSEQLQSDKAGKAQLASKPQCKNRTTSPFSTTSAQLAHGSGAAIDV
jgi:hypothetical protein